MAAQAKGRRRVLLSAYACAPESGSEPGTSWSWIQHLSKHMDISVVTRANNRRAIEGWIGSHPGELENVKWLFVDAPSWILRLKRGSRGIRWYYFIWQFFAFREVKALVQTERHDLAHHISLMGPGFVMTPFLPIPSVVGPFGGLQPLASGFRGLARHPLLEYGRMTRNAMRRASPLWRWQLSRTAVLIVANTATRELLPPSARRRSVLMQIGTDEVLEEADHPSESAYIETTTSARPVRVLWGGVHIGWKGLELLLRALPLVEQQAAASMEVVITGTGVDKDRFERLSDELGIQESVRFVGWVSREKYRELLSSCDIFVFTSLRETTGAALLEAMGMGKASVVIAHGGPADIATDDTSIKVEPESPRLAVAGLAQGLTRLTLDRELRGRLGMAAHRRIQQTYSWPVVIRQTLRIYSTILREANAGGPGSTSTKGGGSSGQVSTFGDPAEL